MKELINAESKRQMVLDAAQIIASYGTNGVAIGELVNKLNYDLNERYIKTVVKTVLIASLGKNNVLRGERRGARYVIDDLDMAVKLINDHFDRSMNSLQLWELYADVADYISKTPAVTDRMVAEEFGVEPEFLDSMNSALLEYGTELEFYKITSNGTKLRLTSNTLTVIQGKINDLTPKVDKVEKVKKLIPLPEDKRKMLQERLLNVIYYLNLGETDIRIIAKVYEDRFKETIKFPTIHSLMDKVPGVKRFGESYQVTDIHTAIGYINPIKANVKIDVAVKKGTDVSAYKNLRYSRELGDYDMYILEDKNSYDIIIQILDLILMGASIDPIIVKRVRDIVSANMSSGHKTLL